MQLAKMRSHGAAAAKSLQSCPTLCDPVDCSLPGSSVHRTAQARVLERMGLVLPKLTWLVLIMRG